MRKSTDTGYDDERTFAFAEFHGGMLRNRIESSDLGSERFSKNILSYGSSERPRSE
jgi:hypothetical protein